MNTQFYQTRKHEIVESLHGTRDNSFVGTPSRRINNSKAAAQAEKIERYARVNHHVLLTGERGTGKTTIARQIHDKSARRKKQFVSLNCATLKEELVEAELFADSYQPYQETEEDLVHEKRLKEIETQINEKLGIVSDDGELGELPYDAEADRKRWDELEKDFDRVFDEAKKP